jgi:hypothetical protein
MVRGSGEQAARDRGGVGRLGSLAVEDVGQGLAGADRELDRRARAGGLVGVRERDVREAERRERSGELGGEEG